MLSHLLLLESIPRSLEDLAAAFRATCPDADVTGVRSFAALVDDVALRPEGTVVVIDRETGDGQKTGDDLVQKFRERHPQVPVVLTAKSGDVESARQAVAAGATDFLVRGASLVERVATLVIKLQGVLALLEENRELRRSVELPFDLVGRSEATKALLELVERVGRVPRPVLIQGERGTGKELVARALHTASRRPGLFIAVNCAAVAEPLLEAELFGYERGAFTGADRRTKGKFESAQRGTLFLDEIGHMPVGFQQKILRAVEYGSVVRVGSAEEIRVDTRIVAATNADLRQKIAAGTFLPDLYDRLAFEVLRIPPLRERVEDIEPLALHFMQLFAKEMPELAGKRLSADAVASLKHYAFPGNVRELKNIIERAMYRETDGELSAADLDLPHVSHADPASSFKTRVESLERELVEDALGRASGNQARAARLLGLSYHQFRYFHAKHFGKRG
ncbi:MAG TPA: sigma 54-interacting transcriptional regulator [Polyangiaceae bacterium]|nr:sigma 54-interacting transcriptional regulator [Polyangiaceae bacterium]